MRIALAVNGQKYRKEEDRYRITHKNYKSLEQNNGFGRLDDVDDTFHIKIREHLKQEKTLKCHHKNCNNKEFLSLESYNIHCHSRYPKQPMYPELSLILQMTGFESKGNPWK